MIDLTSRRELLRRTTLGFGAIALADLLGADGGLSDLSAAESQPAGVVTRAATARSVVFLCMGGGPSQVDTFDPKPLLTQLDGGSVPESIARGVPTIARAPLHGLLAGPWKFHRYGESGIDVSDLFPNVGQLADELCVIRSMRHDSPIHAPAEFILTTGTAQGDRPSLGAWITYGLGSENRNLPGYVFFQAGDTLRPPTIGPGFLPARYQATPIDGEAGIRDLDLPAGMTRLDRQTQLDLLGSLNRRHSDRHAGHAGHSELEARIRAYELSARVQMAAPEALDLSQETAETRRLYGLDQKETAEFGKFCLWTRRLVERGVRFIQLRSGGWDSHNKLRENHELVCRATDRPIAGLLVDLKRRGLLDETLVVWGGEFGRTPTAQGSGAGAGRDHSPSGYCMWLAGGGVRGGQVIGRTDDVGYAAIERPVHPNDLHATILHALGVEQHALYFEYHNRREIVTVNGGEVLREAFA
jgi:hypothetical protein